MLKRLDGDSKGIVFPKKPKNHRVDVWSDDEWAGADEVGAPKKKPVPKRPRKTTEAPGGGSGGVGHPKATTVAGPSSSTGAAPSSGDGAGGVDIAVAVAPAPKTVKRAEFVAERGANQEIIDGRVFTKLNVKSEYRGLSLKCQSCLLSKNLLYVQSGMTKAEAVRRLLVWESCCVPDHKSIGGILLKDFA